MNEKFMLKSELAESLYSSVKDLPIIDYHCHISAKEIAEDLKFSDLTELLLGHDHYKWRIMRAMGIPEEYITGKAPAREKFIRYARSLEYAVGNPLYTWTAMELSRVFVFAEPLTEKNAGEIFDRCTKELYDRHISARSLLEAFNVEAICTTDDPADTLEYHQKIKNDGVKTRVLPTFRPDRFVNIERPDFFITMKENGISTFDELCAFLSDRLDYFCENGCIVADHGLDTFPEYLGGDAALVFERRMNHELIFKNGFDTFKTHMLYFLGKEYAARNITMQLHVGVMRNTNANAFVALGADSGFDSPADESFVCSLTQLLDTLDVGGNLPKTVVYSLNPRDNVALTAMAGNFNEDNVRGKLQNGSAWWFNDHRDGIVSHIRDLASVGVLGNFVGMLTDSRSFTSYVRHEYFRRILCNELAQFVSDGLYANTEKLTDIARDISYYNTLNYFGF